MNSDEQDIRQLLSTWMDATQRGDTQAVLDLMTEDVVFLVAGQPPMMGRAVFEAAMKAQSAPDGKRMQFEGMSDIQEITITGDWAYMWSRLKILVTPPGANTPITRAGHTLTVLRKEQGRWRIARDANLLVTV
jgi:uncharacterized protein (TIGR02246 family)